MNWLTTPGIERLTRYLDLAAFRQSLIASNMANVDTPRYRTRDVDFASELRRAEMTTTPELQQPRVQQVRGLIERPDGNNVNLERESLRLAETQLQFRLGIQLLRAQFRRLLTAINEGR